MEDADGEGPQTDGTGGPAGGSLEKSQADNQEQSLIVGISIRPNSDHEGS